MNDSLGKWLSLFFLLFGSFLQAKEASYQIIQDQTHIPLLTPSLAQRQTLKLRLANGLEAYLIADPEAPKAGAVLTVQVGSWDNPEEYPGMAHFLEHMLFLGTEKYPIESDYDRFIHQHGGQSNAYTAVDHTLYAFSVNPSAFEEGLDRFSFFFKKPLFNPSGVTRELRAIDQEFAKNIVQDNSRMMHVQKELANPKHPFSHFCAGNSSTLSQVKQETLRQWYDTHYSAHLMRLIVCAPLPLETLKAWVIEDFKDISTCDYSPKHIQEPILDENKQGKMVYIKPMKDTRSLQLFWELPITFPVEEALHSTQFISSLLGHEGPGSLLTILKTEQIAESLTCSGYRLGKNHLIFTLDIQLTQEGLENVNHVITRCFQAIQALQKQELPIYHFEELKKMSTFRYQYQSRTDLFNYLMNMGGMLVYDRLETFPEASLIPQSLELNKVRACLNFLTPQHAHFTLLTQDPPYPFEQQEKWMEVPYTLKKIHPDQLAAWSHLPAYPHFHLPEPNVFIPKTLKLAHTSSFDVKPQNKMVRPIPLIDNAQAKIYYAADTFFQVPQTSWFLEIKTPEVDSRDPLKVMLADLYICSLEEILNSYSYTAKLADLTYHLSRTTNGISLRLQGYSENAEVLFDKILEHLKNCQPSESLFRIFKESLARGCANFTQESPLQQGCEIYHHIVYESYVTHQQALEALDKISYPLFLDYMNHLYDQTYVEGLFYGNVTPEQALRAWQKLQKVLASAEFPLEQHLTERIVVLPHEKGPFVIEKAISLPAHALILSIEQPSFSFKIRAAQQILAQAMKSAFYSTLRTKQQTSYIVTSKAEEIHQHLFTYFALQSTTHDPRDLLARVELFIEEFLEEMPITTLTAENFESIRHSLINALENSTQNLFETGSLLNTLAFQYEGDFDWLAKRIQGFKELTYEEFLKIAMHSLGKQNKRRLAILVRGISQNDFHYVPLQESQEMRELSHYRRFKE